ncbi:Methyltransferase domain-containing protein [Streptomyces sp. WMMB 714]|uniref:class I SAM-dependent methyltransferase n=1 Tax=Streptomyces sp. WMMB 714 TaxID=1286822 RepID=UPI0005F7C460|nr:class I SAM-dependent methyltransferase [Streptomyces sp. WMMB 714]SCK53453.1 Methyltransferase domain-containing protein [Streptomyces sp. WMMB 714]
MPFDHNDHYHRLLLSQVPPGARTALDVGCGTGRFARRLAGLGLEVDAIDPSGETVDCARALSARDPGAPAPRYRQADVTELELPSRYYDFISCLASIHHMPFSTAGALRDSLAPGGVLVVLGCYPARTWRDWAWSLAAVPVNAVARAAVAVRERLRSPGAGPSDGKADPSDAERVSAPTRQPEVTLPQIRREAAGLLPGCRIRRLLFWRYLLVFSNSP